MLTLTIPAAPVIDAGEDYLATVYVVTWEPASVGGFEWRIDRDRAATVLRELDDPTARLHVVALPPEVSATRDAYAISEWLDAEGWSDGIDPRHAGAQVTPCTR